MSQTSDTAPCELAAGNGLAGTVGKCVDGQAKQRGLGEVHTACAAVGWDRAGSLDGSELYLTQVLP